MKLNDKVVFTKQTISAGDVLGLQLPEEFTLNDAMTCFYAMAEVISSGFGENGISFTELGEMLIESDKPDNESAEPLAYDVEDIENLTPEELDMLLEKTAQEMKESDDYDPEMEMALESVVDELLFDGYDEIVELDDSENLGDGLLN